MWKGVRAALLATTSVESVAPVAVFQKSPIRCYLSYFRARGLSKIDPNPSLAPVRPRRGSGRHEGAQAEPWPSSQGAMAKALKTKNKKTIIIIITQKIFRGEQKQLKINPRLLKMKNSFP